MNANASALRTQSSASRPTIHKAFGVKTLAAANVSKKNSTGATTTVNRYRNLNQCTSMN